MRFFRNFAFFMLVVALSSESVARCDDFLTSGAGARTVATGGAWLPSNGSPLDAMAINPAGLTLLASPTLEASLLGGWANGQFLNSANPNGRLSSLGAVPEGAFGTPFGSSRWSFGAALLPELLSSANWHYIDTPGGVGGVSYGPLHDTSKIVAMRLAAGVGLDLGRVKFGATFGGDYNSNTLETAYVFQQFAPLAGLKTLLDLHTHGIGWNESVGTLVRANRKLEFGLSYRTRTTVASKGTATGNAGIQLAAIGLGAARPDFRYDAEVDNILPASVVANVVWRINSHTRVVAQEDWVQWKHAFHSLPVILTNGNNADINGVISSNSIRDAIPLDWRDEFSTRIGIERTWLENTMIRAGFAHANSPVPDSTLSPLTAAIGTNTFSAGLGRAFGRYNCDFAYTIDPTAQQHVGKSLIKSGEYDNSTIRVGTQAVVLTVARHF